MTKDEIRIKDGKEYVVKKCPGCGSELLFAREPKGRRVYCMCRKCLKEMEFEIK
jgi:RNase P subunit RPR2